MAPNGSENGGNVPARSPERTMMAVVFVAILLGIVLLFFFMRPTPYIPDDAAPDEPAAEAATPGEE